MGNLRIRKWLKVSDESKKFSQPLRRWTIGLGGQAKRGRSGDEMGRGGSTDAYHSLVRFMEKLEREDLLPVTMSRECRRAGSGLLFDNGADAMSARVLANQSTFAPFAYSFPLPCFVDSCHPSFLRFLSQSASFPPVSLTIP